MQTQLRRFGCSQRSRPVQPSGSNRSILAHAKRKGVSKELQELQQLKANPVPTPQPPVPTPPPPSVSSLPPQSPADGGPSAAPTSPSALSSTSPHSARDGPSGTSSISSSGSGSGLFDNLLVRILGSVTAIMTVISIFYSIVFYGASNVVYVFKDQLAAITKKDFVPYSERRRMEQEVLAKLESEQAARRLATGVGADSEESSTPGSPGAEPDRVGTELLNLLPGSSGKK